MLLLLLLYLYTHLYCDKTLSIVLSVVIDVHLVMVLPHISPKYDDFHTHLDFVILYGSTEGK
jgi:hypothetical protein